MATYSNFIAAPTASGLTNVGTLATYSVGITVTHGLRHGAIVTIAAAAYSQYNGTFVIDCSPATITAITRSGTTATVTTATPHGYGNSEVVFLYGNFPKHYNGSYQIASVSTYTFTFTIQADPGTNATIVGTVQNSTKFKYTMSGTPAGSSSTGSVYTTNPDDIVFSNPWTADTLSISNDTTVVFDGDSLWGRRGLAGAAPYGGLTPQANSGGNITIDASKTWWIPFSTASGNVPTIGKYGVQNCSGGSSLATGEFLGIWTALGTPPISAGDVIPSPGFIKLRSKVGNFVAETLTLPGSASVGITGPGTRGWLSWCQQQQNITFNRLNGFTSYGDWFYLDNATGVDGQVVQNYFADYVPMIEVETASGSNNFTKWYGCYEGLHQTQRLPLSITSVAAGTGNVLRLGCANTGSLLIMVGNQVMISGIVSAANYNGTFTVSFVTAAYIELAGTSYSSTALPNTGTIVYDGTAATPNAIPVTNAASNGATPPLIRLTTVHPHGFINNSGVKISGVAGTTEANGSWIVTTITATTFDLQNSIFANTFISGGSAVLSAWNNIQVAQSRVNITSISGSPNAGLMRLTLQKPINGPSIFGSKTSITSIATGTNGQIKLNLSSALYTSGFIYLSGLAGTGPWIAQYNNTVVQVMYISDQSSEIVGSVFSGNTFTSGYMSVINPMLSSGTCGYFTSATSGASGVIRLNFPSSSPHGVMSGQQIYVNGLNSTTSTGNILALNNKVFTSNYVGDWTLDIQGTTFSGTLSACGLVTPLYTFQPIVINGMSGNGAVNGTYQAMIVDANTVDINVAMSGSPSGGVLSTPDTRGNAFLCGQSGTIKFGGADTGWGAPPPAGCRIRVPNIHMSSTPLQSYGGYIMHPGVVSSRLRFTFNQGYANLSYIQGSDVNFSIATTYSVSLANIHCFEAISIVTPILPFSIINCGATSTYDISNGNLQATNCPVGGLISGGCYASTMGVAYQSSSAYINSSNNVIVDGVNFPNVVAGSTLRSGPTFWYCNNIVMKNSQFVSGVAVAYSTTSRFLNNTFAQHSVGTYHVLDNVNAYTVTSCTDTVIDGLSQGYGILTTPIAGLVSVTNNSVNTRIRNIGTRSRPWNTNNIPNTIISIATLSTRTRIARVYHGNIRNTAGTGLNVTAASDTIISDSGGTTMYSRSADRLGYTELQKRHANFGAKTMGQNQGQAYQSSTTSGLHFADYEVNSTTDMLMLFCTEKTSILPSAYAYVIDSGTPKFSAVGYVELNNIGDQITWTWSYRVLGLSSFANIEPIIFGNKCGMIDISIGNVGGLIGVGCTNHGFTTGDRVSIVGYNATFTAQPVGPYAQNFTVPCAGPTYGPWTVTVTDANSFTLNDSTWSGSYVNGGLCYNSNGRWGNHTITYDIDKGGGFTGSFKGLSRENLVNETGISASIGVLLKIRIVANVASTLTAFNQINNIGFFATTSSALISDNPYQLNDNYETFTGVQVGTHLDVYNASTGLSVVPDYVATGTSMTAWVPWSSDYSAVARLRLCGWSPLEVPMFVDESDQRIPVTQTQWPTVPATNPGNLNITVSVSGSPAIWNGKYFSITIKDNTNSYTATQIANYVHWNIALENQWNGYQGHSFPTMIIPNTTSFETVYGTLYGSSGATLKGVNVVGSDGITPVTGFTRMQADDGSYWSPAITPTLSITGLISGSDVILLDPAVTPDTNGNNIIVAAENISGSSYDYTYTYTQPKNIDIAIYKPGYKPTFSRGVVLSSSNSSIPISQPKDPSYA